MKEGWKQLGTIAEVYNGDSINAEYKKKHYVGLTEGYPFIATKDVSPEGIVDYDNGVKIPKDAGLKVAPADSVFVCAEGGSAGKKIAHIEQDVCFGNKLFCIAPKDKTKYSAKYIYYFCRSEQFRDQFFGELTGLIGGVSSKKFKSIECLFPPLSEQERIVSYLDAEFAKIDALKANIEQQLQASKDLFQSALKQLLTPQEGWEMMKLGKVCYFQNGYAFQSKLYCENGVGVVRISDIQDGEVKTDNIAYINPASVKDNMSSFMVLPGDILIAMSGGTTGKIGINKTNQTFFQNQRVGLFRENKDKLGHMFLYYFLLTKTKESLDIAAGSAQPNLSTAQIKDFIIPMPSFPEQERIAARLDAISEKVKALQANYEQTITLCNDLKQSLLKSIFE